MENKKEEKKGKKIFRTLGIVAITAGICYEIFGRKNQDIKNGCDWVKGKIQNWKATKNKVENNYQNRQNNNQNGGNWNNKRKN